MSIVVRSRESWIAGVLRPKFRFDFGVRDWVQRESWTPIEGMTCNRVQGAIHSVDAYAEACARDFLKLGIAAFESAAEVPCSVDEPRSCAWNYIRYYYAAYFAANALMRLTGRSCLNLSATDCASINSWASAYGVGGDDKGRRLVNGLYLMQFDGSRTPTFLLRVSKGKGGVHAQFWTVFLGFLGALRDDLRASAAPRLEREAAMADLDGLESELKRGGLLQGSWLSEIRNAVNYRFECGAWFPYDSSSVLADDVKGGFRAGFRSTGRFLGSKDSVADIVRAAQLCGFIVGWLRESLVVLSNGAKGEKRGLAEGALDFSMMI